MDEERLTNIERSIADLRTVVEHGFASMRSEMDRRFGEVDHRFDEVEKRFDGVDRRFGEVYATMDRRFNEVNQRIDDTRSQLKVLIEDVRDNVRIVAEGYMTLEERVTKVEGRPR